jgi:hypothetical protein
MEIIGQPEFLLNFSADFSVVLLQRKNPAICRVLGVFCNLL